MLEMLILLACLHHGKPVIVSLPPSRDFGTWRGYFGRSSDYLTDPDSWLLVKEPQ